MASAQPRGAKPTTIKKKLLKQCKNLKPKLPSGTQQSDFLIVSDFDSTL